MEKIGWTDRARNEEVLHRLKEDKNILCRINRMKANWIGHILCRDCLLEHIIEGKIEGKREVKRRRGGRRKMLLYELKEKEDTVK
jgi:hypothetical protein